MSYIPLLLDLAVLYRALSLGTDADLDPTEAETMRNLLRAWVPDEDPARVDHAMWEAARVDVGVLGLVALLERVGAGLESPARVDLRRLATADGRVMEGEEYVLAFVEQALEP